ncbi:MAG: cytidine deaminase [Chitinophagia bacterium]|nr:cytidine deaminase [Chitinophagia bacterium]
MTKDALLKLARRAASKAYSPYSGFSVGAAVLFSGARATENVHVGCNVENVSYGLTICAERNAIFAGITAGDMQITKIAISSFDSSGFLLSNFVPCGACLQVIKEFGNPDTLITVDGRGDYLLAELLPIPFG